VVFQQLYKRHSIRPCVVLLSLLSMKDTVTAVVPVVARSRRARAQLGNLNRALHPYRTYWRRRALKPEDKWALALIADYIPQLVSDKGGTECVTAAEMRLIELASAARLCWLIALAHQRDAECAKFMSIENRVLARLGLERRSRPVPSLASILAAKDTDSEA